jgi:hypothetical protein
MALRMDRFRGDGAIESISNDTLPEMRHDADVLIDELLVERAKNGDSHAFEILIQRYDRKIFHAVLRITANREDAEDVMQETRAKAYTHLAGFEGRSRFGTWFTSIAINQALMCLRKRQRQFINLTPTTTEDGGLYSNCPTQGLAPRRRCNSLSSPARFGTLRIGCRRHCVPYLGSGSSMS